MRRPRTIIESLGWSGFFFLMATIAFLGIPGSLLFIDSVPGVFLDLEWFNDYMKGLKYPIWVYGLFGLGALGVVILIRIEQILWELQSFHIEYDKAKYYYRLSCGRPAYDEDDDEYCGCGERMPGEAREAICGRHYGEFLRWINGAPMS